MKNPKSGLLSAILLVTVMQLTACSSQEAPVETNQAEAADPSPVVRRSINAIAEAVSTTDPFPVFSTTDLQGNPTDYETFSEYQITMVNIWGTFCGPCIAEMPDLETLSQNMPEGTRLVGLVCDLLDESNAVDEKYKNLADEIVAETGVTFTNWIPDASLMEYIGKNITAVPTTLFVDSNGQIIGEAVIGTVGVTNYLNALDLRLALLEGNQ